MIDKVLLERVTKDGLEQLWSPIERSKLGTLEPQDSMEYLGVRWTIVLVVRGRRFSPHLAYEGTNG